MISFSRKYFRQDGLLCYLLNSVPICGYIVATIDESKDDKMTAIYKLTKNNKDSFLYEAIVFLPKENSINGRSV